MIEQKEARDARTVLLAAAAEEFGRHGLKGARVQAIVQQAQLNERMIYHHFGSKEGLYRAVLDGQWRSFASAWQLLLARAAQLDAREGLEFAFVGFSRTLSEHPSFVRLLLHEAMSDWEFAPKATLAQVPSELRELHSRGVREGEFRSDVEFETFYLTLIGALTWRAVFGRRFSDMRVTPNAKKIDEQTVRLILDGLAPRGGTIGRSREPRKASHGKH